MCVQALGCYMLSHLPLCYITRSVSHRLGHIVYTQYNVC